MIQGSKIALSALAVATMAAPTLAQDGPNTGSVSTTLGVDVATGYWFRGMGQENQGVIIQPYVEVGFDLGTIGDDISVGGYVGTWNSYHESAGASVTGGSGWYESDVYAGLGFGIGDFSVDIAYVVLYAPDAGGIFAEEIDLGVGWDDSGFWADNGFEGFALAPYVLLAFETDGGSDAGTEEGIYLELGIEPTFEVIESQDFPVTLAVPVTLGLNIDNYYEDGAGNDDTFGFLSIGAVLSTPLSFIPAEYGSWTGSAGITLLILGDSTETISGLFGTGADDVEVIASTGISMEY